MARWLALGLATPGCGLELADPFLGDGVVIQRDISTEIWGTSSEDEVRVSLDGVPMASATVADGAWSVTLPAQAAAYNRTLMIMDGASTEQLRVSFGEVLLCGGQSNMDMAVNFPNFHADNGTAEVAAAGRYSGAITLKCLRGRPCDFGFFHWYPVTPDTLGNFSAICWYTGKAIYEYHKGKVPIGLIQGENGGTVIERFITNESIATCGAQHNSTTCKGGPDQVFYDMIVGGLTPFKVGAILWDQAEADMTDDCPHTLLYPCLERELVRTWRAALGGQDVPFVAVQLPGYTEHVFEMRLAQEQGLEGLERTALLPTYDLSCPHCPNGAVHNTDKQDVAARVTQQLLHLLYGEDVAIGPRVVNVSSTAATTEGLWELAVTFDSPQLSLKGTRNCTTCCDSGAGDFDVSADGASWVAGKEASIEGSTISFQVELSSAPSQMRYTASQLFPQCGVYNQHGLPAYPFAVPVPVSAASPSVIL